MPGLISIGYANDLNEEGVVVIVCTHEVPANLNLERLRPLLLLACCIGMIITGA